MEQCPNNNILYCWREIKMLKSNNSSNEKIIITKWSDYRFKGGNHSVTKHF